MKDHKTLKHWIDFVAYKVRKRTLCYMSSYGRIKVWIFVRKVRGWNIAGAGVAVRVQ